MLLYNKYIIFFKRKLIFYYNFILLMYKSIILRFHLSFDNKYFNLLTNFKVPSKNQNNGFVLIQLIEDFEFAIKIGAAANALSKKYDCNINTFDCYWDVRLNKPNFQRFFNFFNISTPIQRFYKNFGGKIVFNNSSLYKDQSFILKRTNEIYESLNSTSDILNIKIDEILIGDLIYDSYLRYYHQPTIIKINTDVKYLIRITLDIYFSFKDFINTNKVNALVQAYTTYITHGITARLCLNSGIKVYCIASDSYILQEITKDFPYHGINHTNFTSHSHFKKEDLDNSKNLLEFRFSGGVDSATSYMKNSSYFASNNYERLNILFQKKERNIIIYTHDFFDSPHINRMLQFDDLYKFLDDTLIYLNNISNTNVFIKIHPNGIHGADEIAKNLVLKFNNSNFYILDKDVSNLDIVRLKPDLIGTARGTIGIEMAYFSIPVVALYDNIYINYDFVHSCRSKEEYFKILAGESTAICNFNKDNIYKFYYQAYLEKRKSDVDKILKKIKFNNIDTYSKEYIQQLNKNVTSFEIDQLKYLYTNTLAGYENN